MELKTFVSQTLVEILQGVKDAQVQAKQIGGKVSPISPFCTVPANGPSVEEDRPQNIEFDVAVTTSSGKETSGGIGVYVGAVGLGSKGKSEASHESVSRIKFVVPVVLPTQK